MAQFFRINERHVINLDAVTYVYQYEGDPASALGVPPSPEPWLVIWLMASHQRQDGLHLSGPDASAFLEWLDEHHDLLDKPQQIGYDGCS